MNLRKRSGIKKFTIVLFALLFQNSLSAQINAGSTALNLEKVMNQNERAPFEGVLVPYPQYYYYQEQVELNFEKDILGPECDSCFDQAFWSGVSFLTIGILLGSRVGNHF